MQRKIVRIKTDDITLNVTEEVANKGFDSCVVDEVCPDEEFNAARAVEELEGEEEITVEFLSDYAEEDINDALKELSEKGFVFSLPILVSRKRVTKRGAEHFCNVQLKIPSSERKSFLWPSLKDCPEFFKNVKMLKYFHRLGWFLPHIPTNIKCVPICVRNINHDDKITK